MIEYSNHVRSVYVCIYARIPDFLKIGLHVYLYMILLKISTVILRGSNVRVRGPEKTPIEWSEKLCFRASEPRLRA